MRIIADTNLLVRAVVDDDAAQNAIAQATLAKATSIAVPLPTLCEFVWVLRSLYRIPQKDIGETIRDLANDVRTVVDRPAVEAGVSFMQSGGDFADGVIAFDGRRLGGNVFVSFDRKAVALVQAQGGEALLPSD